MLPQNVQEQNVLTQSKSDNMIHLSVIIFTTPMPFTILCERELCKPSSLLRTWLEVSLAPTVHTSLTKVFKTPAEVSKTEWTMFPGCLWESKYIFAFLESCWHSCCPGILVKDLPLLVLWPYTPWKIKVGFLALTAKVTYISASDGFQ